MTDRFLLRWHDGDTKDRIKHSDKLRIPSQPQQAKETKGEMVLTKRTSLPISLKKTDRDREAERVAKKNSLPILNVAPAKRPLLPVLPISDNQDRGKDRQTSQDWHTSKDRHTNKDKNTSKYRHAAPSAAASCSAPSSSSPAASAASLKQEGAREATSSFIVSQKKENSTLFGKFTAGHGGGGRVVWQDEVGCEGHAEPLLLLEALSMRAKGALEEQTYMVCEDTGGDGIRFGRFSVGLGSRGKVVWQDVAGREVEEQPMTRDDAQKVRCQQLGYDVLGGSEAEVQVRQIGTKDPRKGIGSGLFATKNLPVGRVIGVYGGLLIALSEHAKGRMPPAGFIARKHSEKSLAPPMTGLEQVGANALAIDYAFEISFKPAGTGAAQIDCMILPWNRIGNVALMSINEQGCQSHQHQRAEDERAVATVPHREAQRFVANCKFMHFKHLGLPHVAVITTHIIKSGNEVLLDKYGRDYWTSRNIASDYMHWEAATPAVLRDKYLCDLAHNDPTAQVFFFDDESSHT